MHKQKAHKVKQAQMSSLGVQMRARGRKQGPESSKRVRRAWTRAKRSSEWEWGSRHRWGLEGTNKDQGAWRHHLPQPPPLPFHLALVLSWSWLMFFKKIEFWMPRKLAKTVRIFVEIEHIGNQGSHFDWKESDLYFPCYEAVTSSVAKPWLNSWPLHSVGNSSLILSGQNVTPGFQCVLHISTNILTVLANFLGIQNSNFSKNIGHNRGNTTSWHVQNWAVVAWFSWMSTRVHGPQSPPPTQVCERTTLPLPTIYLRHPTTFLHHHPLLSHSACLKPEDKRARTSMNELEWAQMGMNGQEQVWVGRFEHRQDQWCIIIFLKIFWIYFCTK